MKRIHSFIPPPRPPPPRVESSRVLKTSDRAAFLSTGKKQGQGGGKKAEQQTSGVDDPGRFRIPILAGQVRGVTLGRRSPKGLEGLRQHVWLPHIWDHPPHQLLILHSLPSVKTTPPPHNSKPGSPAENVATTSDEETELFCSGLFSRPRPIPRAPNTQPLAVRLSG